MTAEPDNSSAAGWDVLKLSAGGNDFLVLDGRETPSNLTSEQVRRACTRRLGFGADGLIELGPAEDADARFTLWNADGGRAAFSGNGARCALRALSCLSDDDDGTHRLATDVGPCTGRVWTDDDGRARVLVEMAAPEELRPGLELEVEGRAPVSADFALPGVPCLAVPVDDVDALDLPAVAPPLRHHPSLPDGANVSFYEAGGEPPHRVRTWERGVEGETLSSGTGCATVAWSLAQRAGLLVGDGERSVTCRTGSSVPTEVRLTLEGGRLTGLALVGDARLVATARLHAEALDFE
ncbi:MAG: diaminopimelate epimerase [Acidobacteriota bacterium]